MEDLIEYLRMMREKLEEDPYINFIMEEITNVATDNWVKTGYPDLNKQQLDKALIKAISRNTTWN